MTARHTGTAILTRPADWLECRNPACFSWGATNADQERPDRCRDCSWQLASARAYDVALQTSDGDWALVDRQEVLSRGSELTIRAWAVRLQVRSNGHGKDHYEQPCVCLHGYPTFQFGARDVDDAGRCRYCHGAGVITLHGARTWRS